MRSWTGGFEVLARCAGGSVGASVFVVAEPDGDAVGGDWGGLLGQFASEVLTHFADGQGCEVGEDVSAGGGGSSSRARRRWSGADFLVPEQGGLAQAALDNLFVFAGVWDVPGGRGGIRRCADTVELALEGRRGDTPCGQRCRSGAAGVEDLGRAGVRCRRQFWWWVRAVPAARTTT